MGAIMCMGVATANSVLVVTFARQRLAEGMDSVRAAWEAGKYSFAPGFDDCSRNDYMQLICMTSEFVMQLAQYRVIPLNSTSGMFR